MEDSGREVPVGKRKKLSRKGKPVIRKFSRKKRGETSHASRTLREGERPKLASTASQQDKRRGSPPRWRGEREIGLTPRSRGFFRRVGRERGRKDYTLGVRQRERRTLRSRQGKEEKIRPANW